MPFTAGAAPAGTFPLRYDDLGPYKSSAGNIYAVLRPATTSVGIYKATDPLTSFANVGTNQSASASVVEAIDAYQHNDVLHVAWSVATGHVYYRQFDMAADAWLGTGIETVHTPLITPAAGYTKVSLVVRSTGSAVCAFVASSSSMSFLGRVSYSIRPAAGGAWGTAVTLDVGGTVNWFAPSCVLGAGDRVHFFYQRNESTSGYYQRTLSATLQTAPATHFARYNNGVNAGMTKGVTYLDGATTKVRVPAAILHTSEAGYAGGVLMLDSVDTPTPTHVRDFGGHMVYNAQALQTFANDGQELHHFFASPYGYNEDVWRNISTDGGSTWGADSEEWTGVLVTALSNRLIDRSGKKICTLINDNGTTRYGEMSLITDTTAPAVPTGLTRTVVKES